MDIFALVFSSYQYIKVYSLFGYILYFSFIHNEAFSPMIFSCKGLHVNLIFFFVFYYCAIDFNKYCEKFFSKNFYVK